MPIRSSFIVHMIFQANLLYVCKYVFFSYNGVVLSLRALHYFVERHAVTSVLIEIRVSWFSQNVVLAVNLFLRKLSHVDEDAYCSCKQ